MFLIWFDGVLKLIRKYFDICIGLIRLVKEKVWNLNHLRIHGIEYFIGQGVKFLTSGQGEIDLGRKTWIDKECYFKSSGGKINIGYNNFFNAGVKLTARTKISIGDNNLFGPNVVIVDHDHKFDDPEQLICKQGYSESPVVMGSNIWVGANVLICQGVSICDRVVIAGNAVVTKSIEQPGVYVGMPAKKIKDL